MFPADTQQTYDRISSILWSFQIIPLQLLLSISLFVLRIWIIPIADEKLSMLNALIFSEFNFGKNLIAKAYLDDLGGDYFTVECAGFEPGPVNPLVIMIMKLDGYDLSRCDNPYSVAELLKIGRSYDVLITICSKRVDEKCPDFPGQLLRLNWGHPDPDKVAESRIDRLQQIITMRDSIKADVLKFINEYEEGRLRVLG